jgi:hypothetical protein
MFGLLTYLGILVGLAIAAWRRPAIGIAAVLCLYGLKQWGQSTTAFFSEYRQFTNFAVFVITVIGVVRLVQKRGCLFCKLPLNASLVFALYLYAFTSVVWSPDPQTSFDQWIVSGPYLVTIALLAPLLVEDLQDARDAFRATAIAGGALCALALFFGTWGGRGLVVFGHAALQDDQDIYRYETNPLALSTLGGTVFLIAAMSLGRPNKALWRAFALACIPVSLAVILRSGSRGQFLASGAGLFVGLPIAFRLRDTRSLATLMLIAVVVLGLGWWSTSLVEIDTTRWSNGQASQDVEGRFAMAETLLGAATRNPLTALFGLGNSSAFSVVGYYPHITGLEVIAEEGLLGAALYFTILVLAFRSVLRIMGRPGLTDSHRVALATLAGLFVFELILSWKQGSLLFSVYVFAYAIILGRLEAFAPRGGEISQPAAAANLPRFPNLLR